MRQKNKPANNWFVRLLLFTNCFLAAITVLSYLSPATDPVKVWPVAFLGLAYPILLPVNVIFIIFWWLLRPRFSLISIAAVLIGWTTLTGTLGFRLSEKSGFVKPAGPSLRILTYNVHYFKQFDDRQNSPLVKELMLSVIQKQNPDVICLQEVLTRRPKELDNIAALKKITGLKYVYFVPNIDNSYEAQGLAILSRFPIAGKGSILFPNTARGNEAMFADISAYGKKMRVYNVHLQSIGFQPEDYKYIEGVKAIGTDNPDDIRSTRRIGGRLKRAFLLRSGQVKQLREHTAGCPSPFIIAGDFNDTPGSFAVSTMSEGLKNAFREKGSGLGITYNGDFPNFQIDYILVSPSFEVESYHIATKKLSDHYAVRSDLVLKE